MMPHLIRRFPSKELHHFPDSYLIKYLVETRKAVLNECARILSEMVSQDLSYSVATLIMLFQTTQFYDPNYFGSSAVEIYSRSVEWEAL